MKFLLIFRQQRRIFSEAVQHLQMPFRPEQDLIVVLSVDRHQRFPECAEHCGGCGLSVDLADTAAVRRDFARQQQLVIGSLLPVFSQNRPRFIRERRELCRDNSLFAAGAHQILTCPLPENSLNTVDQNGFSGAGLTGEGIEALLQRDLRRGDDREIFDRKFL